MYDNRIISDGRYVVAGVAMTATNNKINKRPYTKRSVSYTKRKNTSDSFDDTLHSSTSHDSSNDSSKAFSNELENNLRLQSEENARLVQRKFNQDTLNDSSSNRNIAEIELHNKLSQAMEVEVDTSTLYKKVELLNSLKREF